MLAFLFYLLRLRRYKAKGVKIRRYQEEVGQFERKFQGEGVVPGEYFFGFYKTSHILLSDSANCTVLRAAVLTQYRRVTDGTAVASTVLAKRRAVKRAVYAQVSCILTRISPFLSNTHHMSNDDCPQNKRDKSLAVAEIGDRGHNRHGPKEGWVAVPLSRSAGNPSNTMWPAPMSTSEPSGVFIHPAVWPQQCRMPLAA